MWRCLFRGSRTLWSSPERVERCSHDVDWHSWTWLSPLPSLRRSLSLHDIPFVFHHFWLDLEALRHGNFPCPGRTIPDPPCLHLVFRVIPASRPSCDAASLEVHPLHPSPDMPPRVHSHRRRMTLASAVGCHTDRPVPSSWFLTTSTVYSALEFQRYCTPVSEGVRCVSSFPTFPARSRRNATAMGEGH